MGDCTRVEYSASGRAACKKCGVNIDKGALRICIETEGPDFTSKRFHHAGCLFVPRRHGRLGDGPEDLVGFDALKAADQDRLTKWYQGKELPGADDDPAQSPARELASMSPQIVRSKTASQLEAILTANGMKDIAAMGHRELVEKVEALKQEMDQHKQLKEAYSKMTVKQLDDELTDNNAIKSGNKEEKINRCIDGRMFGALPVCPTCQFGKLRVRSYDSKWLHEARGSYFCPGNRDASGWQACPFKAETVTRAAWHAGGQPTGGGASMGASPMGASPMGASPMGASAAAAAASPAFAASPYAPAAPPAKRPRLSGSPSASPAAAPVATATVSAPQPSRVWSWHGGGRGWVEYHQSVCRVLDDAYDAWREAGSASGGPGVEVSISRDHNVHFGNMKQQRKDNPGRSRRVKMG